VVIFIPYTSSFCTLPLVLLNSISGWKKPSLLSALCQSDKEKLTGCQFPFKPKVSLGKRKIFSACLEPSWGVPHSAAPLLFPLAHISTTGSFIPTSFLKALFDLTLHKISHQTHTNHQIVGAGRDLCGSSSPSPLPKQGHLQQAAEDLVQAGLEYLQRRRLHNLSGQPVPVLCHPQREEVLPHVQTELPVPQFVPTAPCPVAGHH